MRLHAVKLIAAAAMLLPLAVHADSFSYRYADLAHFPMAEIDGDRVDVDGDGLQLRGSLPINGTAFAIAELQDLDLENNVDVTRLMVGAGGHWPLGNGVDFIARGGVVQLEVDAGNFDDDDIGLFAGARLRTNIAPNIEVEGGVEHIHVEVAGLDNDTYLIGEGRYNFNSQWSAGLLFTLGGDTNVFGVQGRLNF